MYVHKQLVVLTVFVCVGQEEVEGTSDNCPPYENDSLALYFCSPRLTANCKFSCHKFKDQLMISYTL